MVKYSERQEAAIKKAMEIARQKITKKIAKRGWKTSEYDAVNYAEVYLREGGLCIPGEEDNKTAHELASDLLLCFLSSRNQGSAHDIIIREQCRIHSEISWIYSARSEWVTGFRFKSMSVLSKDAVDFSLEQGVFPKNQVVVVPANYLTYFWLEELSSA